MVTSTGRTLPVDSGPRPPASAGSGGTRPRPGTARASPSKQPTHTRPGHKTPSSGHTSPIDPTVGYLTITVGWDIHLTGVAPGVAADVKHQGHHVARKVVPAIAMRMAARPDPVMPVPPSGSTAAGPGWVKRAGRAGLVRTCPCRVRPRAPDCVGRVPRGHAGPRGHGLDAADERRWRSASSMPVPSMTSAASTSSDTVPSQ